MGGAAYPSSVIFMAFARLLAAQEERSSKRWGLTGGFKQVGS